MKIPESDFKGKSILVVGSGISGISATKLLLGVKAVPILYDGNDKLIEEEIKGKNPEIAGVTMIFGEFPDDILPDLFMAVISPGVPIDSPLVLALKEKDIPVWGEIELGYNFAKGKLIGITGTNGKTTTTTLVGDIMRDHTKSVFIVGNIGKPYASIAPLMNDESVAVAEISSFQLETVYEFRPDVAAILNITPDHLNRHHTMDVYEQTKEYISKNQTKDDVIVLNYEDVRLRNFASKTNARVRFFSSKHILEEGIYLVGDDIVLKDKGFEQVLMNVHDMNLVGVCNYENVMAAILITMSMNVPMDTILRVVKSFKAVEHRIEFVATKHGIDFYNDSKGTNPDAAIQGIRAMNKPTILIGGGYDKGSSYDEWIENFDDKVKCLVLIGQTRDKIKECAEKHNVKNIVLADSFEEAFKICMENAAEGDAVLLSPACASWGMFPNYEVRGQMFKEMVMAL